MKPLQIGVLVIAGALGGAVVMRVWQRPQPVVAPAPAPPAVAQVEPPALTPAPPAPAPAAAPVAAPVTPAPKPPAVRPVARPVRSKKVVPPVRRRPAPVVMAKSKPRLAPSVPAPVPSPATQMPPLSSTPSPSTPFPSTPSASTPPARTEPEHVTPPPPPAPEPEPLRVTLNTGMLIPVRLVDGLSSERNVAGDAFHATLDKELVADGFVIAERGARVEGRVVSADRGGKVKGVASLVVELTRLRTSDDQNVAIQTDSFQRRAEASPITDAAKVGGAAAVGAIIGAIAGGGKGAGIGAGVGGGAGAGDVMLTRGKPATLPSETRLSFRLKSPVNLTEQHER